MRRTAVSDDSAHNEQREAEPESATAEQLHRTSKAAVSEVVSENSVVQSLSEFGEESKDLCLVRRIARASHVNILLHIYMKHHFE